MSVCAALAVSIGGIGGIGLVERLRLGPKPPMVPMALGPAGLFERVCRHAPLPGGRLPGEDKAGNARPGKLFELGGEVLAPASLWVRRLFHIVMELADDYGPVMVLSHQVANSSATACRRPSRSFASLTRSAGS
jgi:hypothetical protein